MKQIIYERKKEKLEAMKQNTRNPKNEDGESCMFCCEENTVCLLLPLCKAPLHPFFVCLECLCRGTEEEKMNMQCPYCKEKDKFAVDTYREIAVEIAGEGAANAKKGDELAAIFVEEEVLGILKPSTPDCFELTATLPSKRTLLSKKTIVIMENIEISSQLFFALLRKTRVCVGERFSISAHTADGDCIKDTPTDNLGETNGTKPSEHTLLLGRHGENKQEPDTTIALENIENIPQNSIGCNFNEVVFTSTALANILPKLKLDFVERLHVTAEKNGHIAGILAQDQMIRIGGIKKIELTGHAMAVFFSLEVQECGLLVLEAWEREHVAPILAQDQMISAGGIQKIELRDCAVAVLPKLEIQGGGLLEELVLDAKNEEHVIPILTQEQNTRIERIQKIKLKNYAVNILLSLQIHEGSVLEELVLDSEKDEHVTGFTIGLVRPIIGPLCVYLYTHVSKWVSLPNTPLYVHVAGILAQEQRIRIGRIKKIELKGYAVAVLPKLEVQECDVLILAAEKREHVAPILAQRQKIHIGGIKKIELGDCAVAVLPKLEVQEGSVLEELVLSAWEREHVATIFAQRQKIHIGRIKKIKLISCAVAVLPKLEILGGGELRVLVLAAWTREDVAPILARKKKIHIGRTKKIELTGHAVAVLLSLEILEGTVLEELILEADEEEDVAGILSVEDGSIDVWNVKVVVSGGCQCEIRKKLKGTNIAIVTVE
ncbi:MAG: uncharacterized protein A8A55_2419 [Amphiamblys sp. WSBS2006]|nr:MAG: uncharacterized protein A8A55_2419 [Amphiamblys sp. WSBS2006]